MRLESSFSTPETWQQNEIEEDGASGVKRDVADDESIITDSDTESYGDIDVDSDSQLQLTESIQQDAEGTKNTAQEDRQGDTVARAVNDSQYIVQGVSPRGTTINLFDYWLTDPEEAANAMPSDYVNLGINKDHTLKFTWGGRSYGNNIGTCNPSAWVGAGKPPCSGIVQQTLVNGYPMLSDEVARGESLDYLFNTSAFDGKQVYTDVDGLLQVDDQGYYYYDSHKNFAQFNADNNGSGDFTLYNTWGVKPSGTSPNGQFFPFNTGAQVLTEQNGTITHNNVKSNDASINHYFGLTMSTRFVQQNNGYTAPENTAGRQPVTYNFSGDDDVWIYIDGVLVGDLGGIHDAASLQIDFSTGEVVIFRDVENGGQYNNQYDENHDRKYSSTTLWELFGAKDGDSRFSGNTFADGTYHTLDFFYLERGGYDSNMSLKYNLVNIPESGVVKVDQNGRALHGVQFALQEAHSDYSKVENGITITAETDANGQLVFVKTNENGTQIPITLEELRQKSTYWVLTEPDPPAGYRPAGDMHLYFYGGVLLSSNHWDTGAYSLPHVTAIAPTSVKLVAGDSSSCGADGCDPADGTMFAVVFQKDGDGGWHPVYGDPYSGWVVSDGTADKMGAVVDAFHADPNLFVLGTGGAYETTIEDLPGDIRTYEYILRNDDDSTTDPNDAKYSVRYYYSEADSAEDVTAVNTWQIQSDSNIAGYEGMDRIFSVTLEVPNIKNELKLTKTDVTDGANTAMSGVEFKLYDTEYGTDGVPKPGAQLVNTMTTGTNGELAVTTGNGLLCAGDYMLIETTPEGYYEEHTAIHIIVDGDGVHVDAGDADDNVTVETGLGTLVYSMKFFAAADKVDATLHDVKAQPQSTDGYEYPGGATPDWKDVDGAGVMRFQYNGDNTPSLAYNPVPADSASTYTAVSGWSRLAVTQCLECQTTDTVRQDLKEHSLNALFTSDVTIHVTNVKVKGSFVIQKILEGRPWSEDDSFKFAITPAINDDTNDNQADGQQTTENAVKEKIVLLPTCNAPSASDDNSAIIDADSAATTPGGSPLEHATRYGDILFTRPGTYTFTISEIPGSLPGMEYSETTFTVTFTVVEQNLGDNKWEAPTVIMNIQPATGKDVLDDNETTYGVIFTNTFTPVAALPLTGEDPTGLALTLVGGGLLLLSGLIWLLAKRRRI